MEVSSWDNFENSFQAAQKKFAKLTLPYFESLGHASRDMGVSLEASRHLFYEGVGRPVPPVRKTLLYTSTYLNLLKYCHSNTKLVYNSTQLYEEELAFYEKMKKLHDEHPSMSYTKFLGYC